MALTNLIGEKILSMIAAMTTTYYDSIDAGYVGGMRPS
jgi:hypothetical protein